MQYMLIFRESPDEIAKRTDPGLAPAYWGAWRAYVGALRESGQVVNGDGLEAPDTATIVRLREGRREIQDGPYPDTHEQLGGYFVINADSREDALNWAARAPCADRGSVEVRPVMLPPGPRI